MGTPLPLPGKLQPKRPPPLPGALQPPPPCLSVNPTTVPALKSAPTPTDGLDEGDCVSGAFAARKGAYILAGAGGGLFAIIAVIAVALSLRNHAGQPSAEPGPQSRPIVANATEERPPVNRDAPAEGRRVAEMTTLSSTSSTDVSPPLRDRDAGIVVERTYKLRSGMQTDVDVPVLVVASRQGKKEGKLLDLKVHLERVPDAHEPLQIAISEDTPGGSGDMMRSSIWMAALIAGLARDDDLSGLRITVQIPGAVDGPSAGGVLCLGIMSALDGRTLPKDFAFTGTILPDGTIGQVGGIVHKMQAAQRGGCTRIIVPDFLRLDEDENTHENVDLKRRAILLGMQFCPVENIHQAYGTIYGIHANAGEIDDRLATELPAGLEELLTTRADTTIRAAEAIFARLSKGEQRTIQTDALFKNFYKYHDRARRAFEAGKMFHACENAILYLSFLKAWEKTLRLLQSSNRADFTRRCADSLKTTLAAMPDDEVTIDGLSRHDFHPLAAQLLTGAAYSKATVVNLDNAVRATVRQLTEADADASEESVSDAVKRLIVLMMQGEMSGRYSGENLQQMQSIAGSVPATRVANEATVNNVARFYYAAHRATWQTFETDVVNECVRACRLPRDEVLALLVTSDFKVLRFSAAEDIHEKLSGAGPKGSPRTFLNMLSTHLCASNIASTSGMIMRWSELEAHFGDNGKMSYGRPQVLSYLLRSSRNSALANLAACHKQGIPCPAAIASFQAAEMLRDDADEDRVNVLVSYWDASLQAQALRMIFSAKANEP
jgi:hypothetical protein